MKNRYKNLDELLDQNAARQLAKADPDRLHADIQRRLNLATQTRHAAKAIGRRLKWAVGLSAAAAMVTVVLLCQPEEKKGIELPAGQCAAVKMIEAPVRSEVNISQSNNASHAVVKIQPSERQTLVTFNPPERQIAQCDITIIDQNGNEEKTKNPQPSWLIIVASKPESTENGQDQLDIACLL